MGSPQNPSADQIVKLKAAGQLELLTSPLWLKINGGQADLSFDLPGEAVSLLRVEWPSAVASQADRR